MKEIKNILICGIGAIGSIYANAISQNKDYCLKVLVDKKRYENYRKNPKIFNEKVLDLDYILPEQDDFKVDLIIIATKYDGLQFVIDSIKNFVKTDTIIMSLLNGVTSEELIAQRYGWNHTLISYYIGNSAIRIGNKISYDGSGTIVFGVKDSIQTDINDIDLVKEFFDRVNVEYDTPEDMMYSYWKKFMLNVSSNQPSAILRMTFGQMQDNSEFVKMQSEIMDEVAKIAQAEGIKNTDLMKKESIISFGKMTHNGKTSMLQDVEAQRYTEVEIFAGTVIKLGKKHGIPTPYNQVMKDMIEVIHQNYKILSNN